MNILNSLAFQENLDKKTLTNLLETLDHIDIKWISREDYSAKN
jgi:hypothetical protein